MTIQTVSQNDTFQLWVSKTNQIIGVGNQLTDGTLFVNGALIFTNAAFSLTTPSLTANTVLINGTGNSVSLVSSNAVVNGALYITGPQKALYVNNVAVIGAINTAIINVSTANITTATIGTGTVTTGIITNATVSGSLSVLTNLNTPQAEIGTAIVNTSVTTPAVTAGNIVANTNIATPAASIGTLTVNAAASIGTSLAVTAGAVIGTTLAVVGNTFFANTTVNNNINVSNNAFITKNANVNLILTANTFISNTANIANVLISSGNLIVANNTGAVSNVVAVQFTPANTNVYNTLTVTGKTIVANAALGSYEAINANQTWQKILPWATYTSVTTFQVNLPTTYQKFRLNFTGIFGSASGGNITIVPSSNGGTTWQTSSLFWTEIITDYSAVQQIFGSAGSGGFSNAWVFGFTGTAADSRGFSAEMTFFPGSSVYAPYYSVSQFGLIALSGTTAWKNNEIRGGCQPLSGPVNALQFASGTGVIQFNLSVEGLPW